AEGLDAAGAGALLIVGHGGGEPDLARFLGRSHLGDAFVLLPREGAPRLGYFTPMERDEAAATGLALLSPEELDVARWTRDGGGAGALLAGVVGQAMLRTGVAPGPVAIAGSWPAGALVEAAARLAADGYPLVSGTGIALRLRKRKSAVEIEEILRVASATCEAFRALARVLAGAEARDGELWYEGDRLRVARLKREVASIFARHELTQPRENILSPGEEGGVPHTTGTPERVLKPGESLIADLFPKGRLFADCTRTFCVGEPPEKLRAAHAAVVEALRAAHDETRPGARGWDLQKTTCAILGGHGFATPISDPGTLVGYVHNLGHGVGYELHELPSFKESASAAEGLLEAGDVVTLEPGLYDPSPSGYGVRLEDLVVIGEDGNENLTALPYELDPRGWG
ncbi:MAG: aminopeptidase P family protein, partial [Acidobacteria bacterium]|nr:aminopeptidase P family protein [Acidobacteriota bacterium]